MTPEEDAIMKDHVTYWQQFLDKGICIVYGPVFDPLGAYGAAIIQVDREDEATSIIQNDPASKINKYDIFPMHAVTGKFEKIISL